MSRVSERGGDTHRNSDDCHLRTVPRKQSQHVVPLRAQSHANAGLVGALPSQIRNHAIDGDRRERGRTNRKQHVPETAGGSAQVELQDVTQSGKLFCACP
jgi:hypothetical protein